MGSTTPLARALEAGPPARMVTAAGRADRYPSRTRRPRTEQVARRPQLPRSFVAQHAEKPLCRCGACPDVYSCSLKIVDQSILKDPRCILITFAHTEPIRNAHTDARHTPRNGTCRAPLTYMQHFMILSRRSQRRRHRTSATCTSASQRARADRARPRRLASTTAASDARIDRWLQRSAAAEPRSDAAAATRCRRC